MAEVAKERSLDPNHECFQGHNGPKEKLTPDSNPWIPAQPLAYSETPSPRLWKNYGKKYPEYTVSLEASTCTGKPSTAEGVSYINFYLPTVYVGTVISC